MRGYRGPIHRAAPGSHGRCGAGGDADLLHRRPQRPNDPIVSNLGQIASRRRNRQGLPRNGGLDKTAARAVFTFVRNLFRGEFGTSSNERAITKDLALFMPATVELATAASARSSAGESRGCRPWSDRPSRLSRMVSLIGVSIPIFWLATVSLVPVHATLHWTVGARVERPEYVTASSPSTASSTVTSKPFRTQCGGNTILPGLVLANSMGLITRITRSSMLEVLSGITPDGQGQGTPPMARRALPQRPDPDRHCPGVGLSRCLSGAVITKTIFVLSQGLGRYAFQSVRTDDCLRSWASRS